MKAKKIINIVLYISILIVSLLIIYFLYTYLLVKKDNTNVVTATFLRNGATEIGKINQICKTKNNKCEIILPEITRNDGVVLGWSLKNGNNADYKPGMKVSISDNVAFYAITYNEYELSIDDTSITYIENNKLKCRAYNTNESCKVTLPNFNKTGYEIKGYSNDKNARTGLYYPYREFELNKNIILYPIYNTLSRGVVINTSQVLKKYNFIVEVEKECPQKIVNRYLNYIDEIKKNANYLLIGSKITFVGNDTFNKIWGSGYVGMNYGPVSLRLVDVKCVDYTNEVIYTTFVHELAHTWDFYYSVHFNKSISDQADYINLFTKYMSQSNRPFRDYSYTNRNEFFADSVKYYYFKYIDKNRGFENLDYPDDIKKVLEKYICITNNNYDLSKCN